MSKNNWIDIKVQQPPNDPYNREYWVYETLNNRVQHDYWVCPNPEYDEDFKPFFNNWCNSVTHWMPMTKYPEPPHENKQTKKCQHTVDWVNSLGEGGILND